MKQVSFPDIGFPDKLGWGSSPSSSGMLVPILPSGSSGISVSWTALAAGVFMSALPPGMLLSP